MAIRSIKLIVSILAAALSLLWWSRQGQPATVAPVPVQAPEACRVSRVVDGDTLDADCAGQIARVRLIGVDTPEVVDPRKTVQCFGHEASDFSKKTLTGQQVRLEADATQDDKDKYGRLLRYVRLADGRLFNQMLIDAGYGFEYTYQIPYQYQKQFKEAEQQARINKAGLWAEGACNGQHIAVKPEVKVATPVINLGQTTTSTTPIKKSRSGICHQPANASYAQTKIFEPYATLELCLKSGGRLPKNK